MARTVERARVAYPGPPELSLIEVEDRYAARGVPARIEPSDVMELRTALAEGRAVVVALDGQPAFVIDIDDVVTVRAHDGALVRVNCDELMDAWAEYDHHVLVIDSVVLIPLSLVEEPEDLRVRRTDHDHGAHPQGPAPVVVTRSDAPTNRGRREVEHP